MKHTNLEDLKKALIEAWEDKLPEVDDLNTMQDVSSEPQFSDLDPTFDLDVHPVQPLYWLHPKPMVRKNWEAQQPS